MCEAGCRAGRLQWRVGFGDVHVIELGEYSELVGLGLLIVGTGLAFAGRLIVARLVGGDDVTGPRLRAARMLAPLTFWAVLAGTVALSLSVLGIGQATRFLDGALVLLPRLFAAAFILIGGHLLGMALRELVRRRMRTIAFPPRAAYWLVSVPAIIAAAQQLGIEVSFIAKLALVAFTLGLGALGLAFALGARGYVANLVARRELDAYREGDRIQVDAIEGTVVELRRTALVLATDDGLVTVPAARFNDALVTRLTDFSE